MTRPGPVSAPPRKLSWPFALGTLLLLPLNVFWMAPPEGGKGGAAYLTGYLLGGVVVLLLLVGLVYGVARLIRRRSAPPRVPAVAFWTLLTMMILNVARATGAGATRFSTTVTAAERQGLQIAADSIWHAGFGFSMPSPGPSYVPAPELQARADSSLADHPDMVGWVLRSAEEATTLVIQLVKFPAMDETHFRAFIRGMRNSSNAPGVTILVDTTSWRPGAGEFRYVERYPSGTFLLTRCIPAVRSDAAFVLCVQTGSADSGALADVRNGLSVRH